MLEEAPRLPNNKMLKRTAGCLWKGAAYDGRAPVLFLRRARARRRIFTVITRRSAVHSAISLIVSLVGVAASTCCSRPSFLSPSQIVLYVGGIMVLFLFVIMLVNLDQAAKQRQFNRQWGIALLCVAVVAAEITYFMRKGASSFQVVKAPIANHRRHRRQTPSRSRRSCSPSTCCLSKSLSVLLLVAVVGSVVMAKKRI